MMMKGFPRMQVRSTSMRTRRNENRAVVRMLLTSALLVAMLSVASCSGVGLWATDIGDILSKPAEYSGSELTVRGRVTKSLKVPFVPGIYWIDDGTGQIAVVTHGQPALSNATVRVRGRVDFVAAVGSMPIGLHIAEIKRR